MKAVPNDRLVTRREGYRILGLSNTTGTAWQLDVWHQRFGPFDGETDAASATCRLVKVTFGSAGTRFRDTVAWFDTAENAAAALELLDTPACGVPRPPLANLPFSGAIEFEVVAR